MDPLKPDSRTLQRMSPFLYDHKFMSNYYGKYSDEALFHPLRKDSLLENPLKVPSNCLIEPLPSQRIEEPILKSTKTMKKEEENIRKQASIIPALYRFNENISVQPEFKRELESSRLTSYEEYLKLSSVNEKEENRLIHESTRGIKSIIEEYSENERQLQRKFADAIAATVRDDTELLHKYMWAWAELRGIRY